MLSQVAARDFVSTLLPYLSCRLVPASPILDTPENARLFANGRDVMLKAVAGGGGKGIRLLRANQDAASAFKLCQSEARAAFGNGIRNLLFHC